MLQVTNLDKAEAVTFRGLKASFQRRRDNELRAEPDAHDLVAAGAHFFRVVADELNQSEPYPIVRNFREWEVSA